MPFPEQIQEAELKILANAEDPIRGRLIQYYAVLKNREARLPHVLWIIEHHPEWQAAQWASLPPGTTLATQADYDRGKVLWLEALRKQPDDAKILVNAGYYFQGSEPEVALRQFRKAYQLDSSTRFQLARMYAIAFTSPERFDSAAMQSIRDDLDATKDAGLLWQTGMLVKTRGLEQQGTMLQDRAKVLDPKIEAAAESGGNPPSWPETPRVKRIRVGGAVQAAKLKHSEPPEYPEQAKQIRLQGTVRFHILIGADGTVRAIQLISGHPLLVQPAQAALQKWVYQTTLLNGEPVEVVTVADVNFTLQ